MKERHSFIDGALINELKIAYWVEKRGEIRSNDTDVNIKFKVAADIQRYRSLDKCNV
ncbi:MAG: hypothetical protein ACPGSN_03895 [Psychrobium sp.]